MRKGSTYSLEKVEVRVIINTTVERHIQSIVLAFSKASIFDVSSAWEEVTISVKRDSHHSVGTVESLFHSISMVDINVDVKHSVMILQQF